MASLNATASILAVEDSDEDFEVLTMTLKRKGILNPVMRCESGEDVFPLLEVLKEEKDQLPGLIILDLNLPGMNGRDLLSLLKQAPRYKSVPVIIFSTSANPKEVEACMAIGANSYSVKPVNLERFEEFVGALKDFWLDNSLLPGWHNR